MTEYLYKLAQTLESKNFFSVVCDTADEAATRVESMLSKLHAPVSVGVGNSETLRQLGLYDVFEHNAHQVYIHSPGKTADCDKNALTSDIYFCSANAVSMDGHIVNIDGTGNRVAATCFGPAHVVYVVGKNKIVPTLEDALVRAKNVAAAGVAKKYGRKTPCAKTGICSDCNSPECVCSVISIHRRKPYGLEITVVLVDEELGI